MKRIRTKWVPLLALMILSPTAWGQIPHIQKSNPAWPPHCAPIGDIDTAYNISRYLRFYPSASMAKNNSVYPGHLISGFQPQSDVVVFSQNQFPIVPSNPLDQIPLVVVVPYWLPTTAVDSTYFKLEGLVGNITPHSFIPGSPTTIGTPGGGGMIWGGANYLCIVGFGGTVDNHILTFIQGYVWRNDSYDNYLDPAP